MKVDLFSAAIGVISLAAFIVPFILSHHARMKKSRRIIKKYLALAEGHDLKISDKEVWNGLYAIGIDRSAFKLFYLQINGDTIIEETVTDLKTLSRCDILNKNRVVNDSKFFERLGLVLKFKSPSKDDVVLDFYSSDGSLTLNGELQLLNKWQGIVSELIKK